MYKLWYIDWECILGAHIAHPNGTLASGEVCGWNERHTLFSFELTRQLTTRQQRQQQKHHHHHHHRRRHRCTASPFGRSKVHQASVCVCVSERAKSLITFTMNYYRYMCIRVHGTRIDKLLSSPRANCTEHKRQRPPEIKYWNLLISNKVDTENPIDRKIYFVNAIAIITTIIIIKTAYIIQYVCMGRSEQWQQQQCQHNISCNSYISDDDRNHTSLFCLLWRFRNEQLTPAYILWVEKCSMHAAAIATDNKKRHPTTIVAANIDAAFRICTILENANLNS